MNKGHFDMQMTGIEMFVEEKINAFPDITDNSSDILILREITQSFTEDAKSFTEIRSNL